MTMNNIFMYIRKPYPNELYHHGIKGQKWGIRRYQNPDGSLTPAGRKRYLNPDGTLTRKGLKFLNSSDTDRETRRNALRNESLKGTKAEQAVNELQKMGFKDDGSGTSDHRLTKNVNTKKYGTVEVTASIDRRDANPVGGNDIKVALSGMEKFGASALKAMKHELQEEVKNGAWGGMQVHIPDAIDSLYVTKFKDNAIVCELSSSVMNKNGDIYGWFSIEFDPKTGKLSNIYYND